MSTFNQLGLSNQVLKAIQALGFETPSEIQAKAIPTLLSEDRDFIGLAQTGTGKTAAFGLPLIERIDPNNRETQALILAPTRELGQQIAEQLNLFSKFLDRINILAVYGGANIVSQIKALRGPQHIVIATPGRLIDLVKRKAIRLDAVQCVVLDEADEMLNMGFKEDIDQILSYTPDEKRTWLFSATMSAEIRQVVKAYMHDPVELQVGTRNEVNENIAHQFVFVRRADKTEAITRFLDASPDMRGVIFCRTRRETQELAEDLLRINYKADALHGDLSQSQRDHVMKRFKERNLQVLVATDVAARGIDVDDISHVFHHSLPDELAYYTHRSGRTARAGKTGISIAFIDGRERSKIEFLRKKLSISFEQVYIPRRDQIFQSKVDSFCMEILEQPIKGKLDTALLHRASLLFGNISKEELIAKILTHELDKFELNDRDLNEAALPQPKKKPRSNYQGNFPKKKKPAPHKSKGNATAPTTAPRKKKPAGKKNRNKFAY